MPEIRGSFKMVLVDSRWVSALRSSGALSPRRFILGWYAPNPRVFSNSCAIESFGCCANPRSRSAPHGPGGVRMETWFWRRCSPACLRRRRGLGAQQELPFQCKRHVPHKQVPVYIGLHPRPELGSPKVTWIDICDVNGFTRN